MARRVVIWDLGGVFIRYVPMDHDPIFLGKCAAGPEAPRSFFGSPTWRAYECGEIKSKEFFEIFKTETGYSGDFGEFVTDFSSTLGLNAEMYDYFQELRSKRKDLDHWLLSNLNPLHYDAAFIRRGTQGWPGILSSFSERYLFFSHLIHMRKGTHDQALWDYILTDGEANPKECIFVDDKKQNGEHPASIGILFVHFDGNFEKFKIDMASALGQS